MLCPDDLTRFQSARRNVQAGQPTEYEARIRNRDGTYHWWSLRASPIFDDTGQVVGRSGGWRDIQDEMQARLKLEAAESRFRMLATQTSDVIVQVDGDGVVQWVSPSVERAMGWKPDELVGRPSIELVAPEDRTALVDARAAEEMFGPETRTFRGMRADGSTRWVEAMVDALPEPASGAVVRLRDVEQQVRSAHDLEQMASTDPLTGLLNRRAAMQRMEAVTSERRSGHHNAVMFVDLDQFKHINDTYGHDTGDMVLKTQSSRITSLIRDTDFAARVGGDELLVVLTGLNAQSDALRLAERIRIRCSEPVNVGGGLEVATTLSIGLAFSRDHESVRQLMSRADRALYRAKTAGRNNVQADLD